jgi:carboxypeptidase Q
MRNILEPFKADGVIGAVATRSRRLGGSDNTSFNQAGLPGIGMGQDPIEYGTHTWHTNLDTYERILEDDVKKDAMVVAWAIYQLAMRDDLLPRFSRADLPAKPASEETSAQPATPAVRTEGQTKKPLPKKVDFRRNTSRRRGR